MTYRSTTLRMIERHCPYALTLYERRTPADYSATECGTAAHAVLHEAGKAADKRGRGLSDEERHTIASETVARLTTEGRSFDGVPEPPLSILPAQEGARLALDWLAEHGERMGRYELPLGMTQEGKPAPYESAWYRGILDHAGESDANLEIACEVTDYKSYWSAGEAELHGIQLRGQAVLAHANGLTKDCDVLNLQVANLRTLSVHRHQLYLRHPSAEDTLRRWRLDLIRLIQGLERSRDETGALPASPGPACHGCPYIGSCDAAARYLDGQGLPKSREDRARLLGVLEARRNQVRDACKADCDRGPVSVGDRLLGFHRGQSDTPIDLVEGALWSRWSAEGGQPEGLIHAMRPTTANLRYVARAMHEGDREAQDRWLEDLLTTKPRTEFGFAKITDEMLTKGRASDGE